MEFLTVVVSVREISVNILSCVACEICISCVKDRCGDFGKRDESLESH